MTLAAHGRVGSGDGVLVMVGLTLVAMVACRLTSSGESFRPTHNATGRALVFGNRRLARFPQGQVFVLQLDHVESTLRRAHWRVVGERPRHLSMPAVIDDEFLRHTYDEPT